MKRKRTNELSTRRRKLSRTSERCLFGPMSETEKNDLRLFLDVELTKIQEAGMLPPGTAVPEVQLEPISTEVLSENLLGCVNDLSLTVLHRSLARDEAFKVAKELQSGSDAKLFLAELNEDSLELYEEKFNQAVARLTTTLKRKIDGETSTSSSSSPARFFTHETINSPLRLAIIRSCGSSSTSSSVNTTPISTPVS